MVHHLQVLHEIYILRDKGVNRTPVMIHRPNLVERGGGRPVHGLEPAKVTSIQRLG